MGRFTRYRALPDSASDARITDLDNPLHPPKAFNTATGQLDRWKNLNIRNTTPITLVGGADPIRVLGKNYRRTGLIIQNRDTAASLFIAYGNANGQNTIALPAGGILLEDFTCPSDEVYLSSTANIIAVVVETVRGYAQSL